MNTYDEGKDGEETSLHTTRKIGSENKNKVFTEEEKAAYLSNLRNKYKNQKSIEQQFAEAKLVPEKDKEHFIYEIAIEVLEKNPYILEDTLALIDSALLLNLGEEEVRARAEKNKKELDKLFGNNDKDEIDNLNDIKNYKTIIISNNKNAESEKENKDEQVTNVESVSASSPSPLPDPNNKDDKEMKELKKKWGKWSFDDVDDSIEHHYKKHDEEVGASDLRQYLRKAKEFARNLKRARRIGEVKGATPGVVRYEKMGKYIDLAPNGDIISFAEFNPLNPLK